MGWSAYNTADDIGGTAFNGVADGSGALLTEIDNSAGYTFGDLEVSAATAIASSGLDARIDVYIVPAYDGSAYPTPGTASTFTGTQKVGVISSVETVGTVAATNYSQGTLRGILLPATKFKTGLVNELGATTAAGMTVKMRRYNAT